MSPEQIDFLLRREPFRPFRIHLSNGASFDIRKPQMVAISGRMLSIGQNRSTADDELFDEPDLVAILHINFIEPILPETTSR